MACEDYSARLDELEDYLNGELNGAAAVRLTAHLGECAACRQALEAAREVTSVLRAGLQPAPEPSWGFAARVAAQARAASQQAVAADFWDSLETFSRRMAWASAALLVLLGGYLIYDLSRVHPTEVTEVREIFSEPVQQPADPEEVLLTLASRNGR